MTVNNRFFKYNQRVKGGNDEIRKVKKKYNVLNSLNIFHKTTKRMGY